MPLKTLKIRERELLLQAFDLYEKRADSLKKGLEELGISATALDTAIGHAGRARMHVEKAKDGTIALDSAMEGAFRSVARDALMYNLVKLQKVQQAQLDLLVDPADTQETIGYVNALRETFSDQLTMVDSLNNPTGPMSGRKSHAPAAEQPIWSNP